MIYLVTLHRVILLNNFFDSVLSKRTENKVSVNELIAGEKITISIVVMALAGLIVGRIFSTPETQAAIIIITGISWLCLVACGLRLLLL